MNTNMSAVSGGGSGNWGDCPGLGDILSAYLDDELDVSTRQSIAAHLGGCLRCNQELAELRQVKRFLAPSSSLAPPLPAALAKRVRSQVYGSESQGVPSGVARSQLGCIIGRSWLTAPALAGALILLLTAIGVLANFTLKPLALSPTAAAAIAFLEDHIMCDRLGQVPQSLPGNASQVRAQLANVIGMSVAAPSALTADYAFAGGRAFRAASLDSAHLAWMEGEHMLSFYQAADPGGDPPANWRVVQLDGRSFWLGTRDGEKVVLWRNGGVLYILAGDLDEANLLRLALSV